MSNLPKLGKFPPRPLGFAANGRRWADWWADAGLAYPGRDREQSTLFELGALSEDEAAALVASWREQFDRANEPGFAFCMGTTGWLTGRAAKRAHYAWYDVPQSLVEKWTAELVGRLVNS